ncbi:unnamed protein product, partial [Tuber aestivum]
PLPPIQYKHNRCWQAKILPHLEPLDRHYPKGNPDIWPRGDAEVNGDLSYLPRRTIHGSRRQPRICQYPNHDDIPVGLGHNDRRSGCEHILVW